MSKRSATVVKKIIDEFLMRQHLFKEDCVWNLKESPLGGIGVFAKKDIEVGEEIFKDFPIIIGPRITATNSSFCVVCYGQTTLEPCSKNCGLPICSAKCKKIHASECELIRTKRHEVNQLDLELFKTLTPLRYILLKPEDRTVIAHLKSHRGADHGLEIDKLKELGFYLDELEEEYLRFICCVMDANAFEVVIGKEDNQSNLKGLYPLASLVNHSCTPNIMHVFDKDRLMVVRACVSIKEGEELFHSYVRLIWSTPARQYNLSRTKHFTCRCTRCSDPREFGTYMSAFLCKICKGNVISTNPLSLTSEWMCEDCHTEVRRTEIANVMSMLGSILNSFSGENLEVILKFLKGKLTTLVPENNEIVVELKYKILWIIGYHEKYKWGAVDSSLIDFKLNVCDDLLELLEKLRLGECKLKGLLLYEIYLCLKEKYRRNVTNVTNGFEKDIYYEIEMNLKKAAAILKDDVVAPADIQYLNNNEQRLKNSTYSEGPVVHL